MIGGINSSRKRYERVGESEEKNKLISKGSSVSKSMNRIMRASPKIHLKQHIHNNNLSHSTHKKSSGYSNGLKNKLRLNRHAIETGLSTDSSKNQKLENLFQKHVLRPIRTTNSASRPEGKLFKY